MNYLIGSGVNFPSSVKIGNGLERWGRNFELTQEQRHLKAWPSSKTA